MTPQQVPDPFAQIIAAATPIISQEMRKANWCPKELLMLDRVCLSPRKISVPCARWQCGDPKCAPKKALHRIERILMALVSSCEPVTHRLGLGLWVARLEKGTHERVAERIKKRSNLRDGLRVTIRRTDGSKIILVICKDMTAHEHQHFIEENWTHYRDLAEAIEAIRTALSLPGVERVDFSKRFPGAAQPTVSNNYMIGITPSIDRQALGEVQEEISQKWGRPFSFDDPENVNLPQEVKDKIAFRVIARRVELGHKPLEPDDVEEFGRLIPLPPGFRPRP